MGLLTYLVDAKVEDSIREIDGTTLTRPSLKMSDGTNVTYAVDVDIGQKGIDPVTSDETTARLRNVPLASAANEVVYAEVGAAVRLRRSESGKFEVIGFSKRKPGTYTRVAVTIPAPGFEPLPYVTGTPVDAGYEAVKLTYEQLQDYGLGYGAIPYGAVALFQGGEFIEVQ